MGPQGAVEIIFRKEIKEDVNSKDKIVNDYKEKFASPFVAASRGFLDEVIRPRNTRKRISQSLQILKNKHITKPWKKHDNLPL
jgi:propionyl-CoA carboxylase beta chain